MAETTIGVDKEVRNVFRKEAAMQSAEKDETVTIAEVAKQCAKDIEGKRKGKKGFIEG